MAQPVSLTLTGVGISPWKNLNFREPAFHVQFNCLVTGTVTFNLETTASDYLTPGTTVIVNPSSIAAGAATAALTLSAPQRAWRLNILTGTGSVTVEAMQSGY
jgi:hypothetical protein